MNQILKYIIPLSLVALLTMTGCRDFDEDFLELEPEVPEMTEPGVWIAKEHFYFDAGYERVGFELRALGGKWTLIPKQEYAHLVDYSPKDGEDGNFIIEIQVLPNSGMVETDIIFILKQENTNVNKEITVSQYTHESKFSRASDSLVLVKLAETLRIDGWRNKWDLKQPITTWAGVTFEEIRGEMRVVGFGLKDFGLQGDIPLEFGNLRELKVWNMMGDKVSGNIPATIANLRNLHTINVQFSKNATWYVPENMANMLALRTVKVGELKIVYFENLYELSALEEFTSNGLTGELQGGEGKWGKVRKLDFTRSEIEKLPYMGSMTSLEELSVSNCTQLSELPESLCELVSLQKLNVSSSGLKTLPDNIGSLPNLQPFSVSYCAALETLPESFCDIPYSGELTFSGCTSLKSLPSRIGAMSGVTKLNLSSCDALLGLPDNMGTTITDVNMSYCTSVTVYPSSLSTMAQLKKLDISAMGITSLPDDFGNSLTALEELTINSTNLTSIPTSIGNLTSLRKWSMSYPASESITGDGSILHALVNLESIDVGKCTFDGAGLGWIEKMPKLTSLKVSQSKMGGTIDWSKFNSLTALDLSDNQISGTLDGIGTIPVNLKSITLNNNLLVGDIPVSIGQCTKLSTLSLTGNNITGTIPVEILNTELTNWGALGLNLNRMSGEIPELVLKSTMWSRWSYLVTNQQEGYGFSNVP